MKLLPIFIQVGVYIYDKAGGELDEREREISRQSVMPGYPSSQVARMIEERAAPPQDREELRTPVDLQDIVEKLNTAIKDCRMKNNLKLDELSPDHETFTK